MGRKGLDGWPSRAIPRQQPGCLFFAKVDAFTRMVDMVTRQGFWMDENLIPHDVRLRILFFSEEATEPAFACGQQYALGRIDFSDLELQQRYSKAGHGPDLSAVTVPPPSLASGQTLKALLRPELSRNLCIFCQKALSIVVNYRVIHVFSCKKPYLCVYILSLALCFHTHPRRFLHF